MALAVTSRATRSAADRFLPRRLRLIVALTLVIGLAVALCPAASYARDAHLTAHFVDVGQGDAIWVRMPDGSNILVDAATPEMGSRVLAHLLDNGVAHLDLIVATHGHSDHIGGLPHILEAMPVAKAWLDSQACQTQTCLSFYKALASRGVLTSTVRMGKARTFGDVTVMVLNPSEPLYANANENSVVLRITYGTVLLLLTGDAERGAERRMIASGLPLAAEILKVAHHGSNSSSTAEFLKAVGPRDAVISVGPNPYGHPRSEVLQRLEDVGATIWRTDELGTIVLTTCGSEYALEPALLAVLEPPWLLFVPLVAN